MTNEEFEAFTAMSAQVATAYKGDAMILKAACRAAKCGPESICDTDEAIALVLENGWTWTDVLNANS